MPRRPLFAALAAVLLLVPAAPAAGQVLNDSGPGGPPPGPEVVELTVSPAPLPSPPLKYRLTVPPGDRVRGDATVFWYRSQILMLEVDRLFQRENGGDRFLGLAASRLAQESPADLTAERIDADLGIDLESWSLFGQMRAAARRTRADWDFGVERLTGREVVHFPLPEFQNARDLARLGLLRARSRLGRGDPGGALADAAVNLRLAEHCGAGPFLICDLVGLAIHSFTLHEVVQPLIAAPGSPNLYHALSELPDPAAGLADSWEYELTLPYRIAPWLSGAADRDWPADRWVSEIERLYALTNELDGIEEPSPGGPEPGTTVEQFIAAEAPAARDRLTAGGLAAERVAAMSDGQAVAAAWDEDLRAAVDRFRLAVARPLPEAYAALGEAEETAFAGGPGTLNGRPTPLTAFLPAVRQAAYAGLRARVDLDALRVVEALRTHAAAAGAFPASLDDVAVAAVPENPLTGEPFGYRLEGGTAVLTVLKRPADADARDNREFRLTLREE